MNRSLKLVLCVLALIGALAACQPSQQPKVASQLPPTPLGGYLPVAIPLPGEAAAALIIRLGPGSQFPPTDRQLAMEEGAPVVGRTVEGDWWQVKIGNQLGWVQASQVEVNGPVSEVPIVATPAPAP